MTQLKIAILAGLSAVTLLATAAPSEAAKFSGRERYDGLSRWHDNDGYRGYRPYRYNYGWTGGYPVYNVYRPRFYGYYGWNGDRGNRWNRWHQPRRYW